eukprot:GEMP01084574.1.p1 GENE.GEMP01084574.1~~GEMP01084574.1.p1  ORF type:complete len:151 (+),score=16.86 GEMP01084574.1:23-454(+)
MIPSTPQQFTLILVYDGDRVLLGKKKRGKGHGKYNGFGGKPLPEESLVQCAQRELREECALHIEPLRWRGAITFYCGQSDTPIEVVTVYDAPWNHQAPTESDEMVPEWFHRDALPVSEMWADCIHWLPGFLTCDKIIQVRHGL